MSLTNCAITGEPLSVAVVSKKSGHVYEKHVIEKYIDSTGKCPITGEVLSHEDLLPLQVSKIVRPKAPNATSVPQMLTLLQSEWDAVMLETFTLKQHLEVVRQELSHALYQHDAACRVIARLLRERDDARAQMKGLHNRLQEYQQGLVPTGPVETGQPGSDGGSKMQIEWLNKDLVEKIENLATELNTMRKHRKKQENAFADFATPQEIASFKTTGHTQFDGKKKLGITTFDIDAANDQYIVMGSNDGHVAVYDRTTSKVIFGPLLAQQIYPMSSR